VLDPLYIEGIQCIQQDIDCLGDTRDAAYMDGTEPLMVQSFTTKERRSPAVKPKNGPQFILTDNPNDFAIIIGVIHTMTSNR